MSRRAVRNQYILELRIAGHSGVDVAKMFNVSVQRVHQIAGKIEYDRACYYCGRQTVTISGFAKFCSSGCAHSYRIYKHRKWTPIEKYMDNVEKTPSGCWEWRACINKATGYGHVRYENSYMGAHRAMWIIRHGGVPDNLYVLHKCDNPICVNPDHLYLGNAADNARDRDGRGRHQTHVLSVMEVAEIRRRFALGCKVSLLAEKHGVHPMTIYNICRGKSHKGTTRRKLSDIQQARIANVYSYGNHTYASLGLMYHVNPVTIGRVIKRLAK